MAYMIERQFNVQFDPIEAKAMIAAFHTRQGVSPSLGRKGGKAPGKFGKNANTEFVR
jgi:hypothetical protein